jgi:alkylation response protein AidB-like acyl-CoA dehydrogenase
MRPVGGGALSEQKPTRAETDINPIAVGHEGQVVLGPDALITVDRNSARYKMDFSLSEEQIILRDSVRKLMDRASPIDYVRRLDREQAYPYELYEAWVEAGLLRLPYPEEYGGVGGSVIDLVLIAEEISRKSADFFMAFAGSTFCGLNILRKASEEQKRYWLPKIADGRVRMAISISEPGAGSDVGALRTMARRDGNDWIINGHKLWSTGAGAKDAVINVYVKTDPAVPIQKGMSLFLVDNDTPGLEIRKLDMLGRRCVGTYDLIFNDVRVPGDRLIGGQNRGWGACSPGFRLSVSAQRREIAGRRRPPWISPSNMPRSASNSGGQSARSR